MSGVFLHEVFNVHRLLQGIPTLLLTNDPAGLPPALRFSTSRLGGQTDVEAVHFRSVGNHE